MDILVCNASIHAGKIPARQLDEEGSLFLLSLTGDPIRSSCDFTAILKLLFKRQDPSRVNPEALQDMN